jgi:ribosomal protein S18 acetylase RimI-like enzyme
MIRLRPGAYEDAAALAQVHVATWRDAYAGILPTDMLVRMSVDRQTRYWRTALMRRRANEAITVATVDEILVGFGTCGPARGRDAVRTGEVQMLYVDNDYQERGLGRALLRALFAALRRHRMDRAVIWVVAQNPARFFYEAMGGTMHAERSERLWNADIATLSYVWEDLDATIQALDNRIARVNR